MVDNNNILREIEIALCLEIGSANEHYLSKSERYVIPPEYQDVQNVSTRRLRDYLILRQYIKAIDLIAKSFEFHREGQTCNTLYLYIKHLLPFIHLFT